MKNNNIFHICTVLIALVLVLCVNSLFVNHYSKAKILEKQVSALALENSRFELEMELQEIEMVEFRQEVAKALPKMKNTVSDYGGRQLASVLGGSLNPQLDEGFSKILLKNAKADFAGKKYSQAKVKLKKYIEKYPHSTFLPESYLMLLEMEFKEKDYEKAIEYINHLVSAYPSNEITAHSLFILGEIMQRQERLEDASDLYRTIIDAFPVYQITKRAKKELKALGL